VFSVPSRPIGMPIQYKGAYWMRSGEDLVGMTPDMIQRIFLETALDFSAEVCPKADLDDLSQDAVSRLREMWLRSSGNAALQDVSAEQLLTDAELLLDEGITNAALILLGTHRALGKHLAQVEAVFEFRSTEASVSYQQRKEYREGFFIFQDDLWKTINLRNDMHHFQDGLFVWDVPSFNEAVVREAVLNAVSHRDYRLGGSIFVRQYPRRLEIVSPGGFPPGITPENILWRQMPRNRRIAEVLSKCGLVERSGQGTRRMFEECIKESKALPDFTGTDDYQVSLTLQGEVQDLNFLRFLERIGQETQASFSTKDFLLLDLIHKERPVPQELRDRVPGLLDRGVVERVRKGKFILSRRFYSFVGRKGVYTRKRGLDRNTMKALLLRHIRDNSSTGSRMQEFMEVLPGLTRNQVHGLLKEMKKDGRARPLGSTRAAKWYPLSDEEAIASNLGDDAKERKP
jgi:ATP-dependent DNA helicase RecG